MSKWLCGFALMGLGFAPVQAASATQTKAGKLVNGAAAAKKGNKAKVSDRKSIKPRQGRERLNKNAKPGLARSNDTPDSSVPSTATTGPQGLSRYIERGYTSWYGAEFHGRRTASGDPFNPNELTAAHRTLPFGTQLKVTDLSTGKSVVVRVNDRGPHTRSRMLDLSSSAANVLGIKGRGVAHVQIESAVPGDDNGTDSAPGGVPNLWLSGKEGAMSGLVDGEDFRGVPAARKASE